MKSILIILTIVIIIFLGAIGLSSSMLSSKISREEERRDLEQELAQLRECKAIGYDQDE